MSYVCLIVLYVLHGLPVLHFMWGPVCPVPCKTGMWDFVVRWVCTKWVGTKPSQTLVLSLYLANRSDSEKTVSKTSCNKRKKVVPLDYPSISEIKHDPVCLWIMLNTSETDYQISQIWDLFIVLPVVVSQMNWVFVLLYCGIVLIVGIKLNEAQLFVIKRIQILFDPRLVFRTSVRQ